MAPILKIVSELKQCLKEQQTAAVAIIIAVKGSAYRREGARCLIYPDGRITGIISGGCVESDLFEHALEVMETSIPKQVEYDFRSPEDDIWGLGLGCNGAITIWLQPFNPKAKPDTAHELLYSLEEKMKSHSSYWSGTVISTDDDGKVPAGRVIKFDHEPGCVKGEKNGLYEMVVNGVKVSLFLERVNVRQRIVIMGGGEDTKPIVLMAKSLDWHVTVVDHREELPKLSSIGNVDEWVITSRNKYGDMPLIQTAAVVIKTHNYELDKIALGNLLKTEIAYIGQLGPRVRTERMLTELCNEGIPIPSQSLKKLHSPIGLDLGAETPEEIALCIISEICANRNNRNGASLKEKYPDIQYQIASFQFSNFG